MSTPSTNQNQRQQVLDAAQRCFLRNGLHGTSMADVAAEAGLPEETVSSHFGSRDELVDGIAGNILAVVSGFFEQVRRDERVPPLEDVVERFAQTVIASAGRDGAGRLAAIYWASALYNEHMASQARQPIEQGRAGWTEIAERQRAAGNLPPGAEPKAVGALLACLMPGILLQHVLLGDVEAADFRLGAAAVLGGNGRPTA